MSILLKNIKIVDSQSPYNGKRLDVYIEKDQIKVIGENLKQTAKKTIDGSSLSISPGWVALDCNFNDPGNETSETLESGNKAAQMGGFTSVVISPETNPVIDNKASVEYIYNKADHLSNQFYVLGAITKNLEGKELAELYDMSVAGAHGFSNGKSPLKNPNLLKLALLYTKPFNAPIIVFPNHPDLSDNGQMNEGETSTFLGLKGIPSIAEEMIIARDIALAEYCEAPIHFSGISTAKSVELIREAKAKGLPISASVHLYNLVLTDKELELYDSNLKVMPPLRTDDDRLSLIEGLKDNTIDCISIDHMPLDIEYKKCEFNLADFGMRTLESVAGIFGKYLAKELSWSLIVDKVSKNPRELVQAPRIAVKEGSIAELTIFDEKKEWLFDKKETPLKSYNNPFLEQKLKGCCIGVIAKGQYWKNS